MLLINECSKTLIFSHNPKNFIYVFKVHIYVLYYTKVLNTLQSSNCKHYFIMLGLSKKVNFFAIAGLVFFVFNKKLV
jgi:hypothetical protein